MRAHRARPPTPTTKAHSVIAAFSASWSTIDVYLSIVPSLVTHGIEDVRQVGRVRRGQLSRAQFAIRLDRGGTHTALGINDRHMNRGPERHFSILRAARRFGEHGALDRAAVPCVESE